MNSEERSNEEKYPRGSIGHTFPEAAALMEGLLAERNALESRLAAVERERDEAVTSLAEARGALPNIAQLIQNWSAVERERGQLRVANNRLLARIAAVEALIGDCAGHLHIPAEVRACPYCRVRAVLAASPTPTGPEPARCEHKRTEAHQMLDEFCEWTADCPGPATPEPTEETL